MVAVLQQRLLAKEGVLSELQQEAEAARQEAAAAQQRSQQLEAQLQEQAELARKVPRCWRLSCSSGFLLIV
jgi:hypothetical protein